MKHDAAGDVLATTAALWLASPSTALGSMRRRTPATAAAAPLAQPLGPEDELAWRSLLGNLPREATGDLLGEWHMP